MGQLIPSRQPDTILGKPHHCVETGGSYLGHQPEMPREYQGKEPQQRKATCDSVPSPSRTGQMSLLVYLHAFVSRKVKGGDPIPTPPYGPGLVCRSRKRSKK